MSRQASKDVNVENLYSNVGTLWAEIAAMDQSGKERKVTVTVKDIHFLPNQSSADLDMLHKVRDTREKEVINIWYVFFFFFY
jgi:hypothetical protein